MGCSRWRGFSIVEVLIVVMVIAIAAALAVPRMRDSEAAQLRSAANLLLADLSYAQAESITHATDTRLLVLGANNKTYWIAAKSKPNDPITNPADRLPYKVVFGESRASALGKVTIFSSAVGGDARLGFGAYGQLDQTSAATITLTAGGMKITLTVDPVTGQTTIGSIQ